MSNLTKRILTAAVLIPALVAALFVDPTIWSLLGIVAVGAWNLKLFLLTLGQLIADQHVLNVPQEQFIEREGFGAFGQQYEYD